MLWSGRASTHHTFHGVIEYLIDELVITDPGVYVIIRLDRTVDPEKKPELPFVGTVKADMTVIEGVLNHPTIKNLTRWPPK